MNNIILARTSLRALRKHKTRSLLTILGIMIGIAAIIVTFSIGRGAEKKVRDQIMAMGENATYIIPGNIVERGGRVRSTSSTPVRLQTRDLEVIKAAVPEVLEISRGHESLQLVKRGSTSVTERVLGYDANILKISKNKLKSGSFFND